MLEVGVWMAGVLLLGDLTLLGYLLVCRAVGSSQQLPLTEFAPLIVGAGVFVAIITLVFNMRRQQSEDYLENASGLLEKAHTVLAQLDEENRPKNIRINWMTAARLLKTSDNISKRITEPSHKAIYEADKKYWGGVFCDLIKPNDAGLPEDYFATSPETFLVWHNDDRKPLEERSLAVLYRFVRWKNDDPMKDEPSFTDEEIENREMLPDSLRALMKKVRELERQERDNTTDDRRN